MSWCIITTAIIFVVCIACSPIDNPVPATDAESSPLKIDSNFILTTYVTPSLLLEEAERKKIIPSILFVINVQAVKNDSAIELNDVLQNDVMEEVSNKTAASPAMVLLVVEDGNESHPVDLNELAKNLENEGFAVKRIMQEGKIRIVQINLDNNNFHRNHVMTKRIMKNKMDGFNDEEESMTRKEFSGSSNKLTKIRKKRTFKFGSGRGGGGGCRSGCGTVYYQQQPMVQRVPVIVPVPVPVPVQVQSKPVIVKKYYVVQSRPQHYVSHNPCDPCRRG